MVGWATMTVWMSCLAWSSQSAPTSLVTRRLLCYCWKKLIVGFKVKSLLTLTRALMLVSQWKHSFSACMFFIKGSIFHMHQCFGVQYSWWKVTLVRCGLCFSLGGLHTSSVLVSFVFSFLGHCSKMGMCSFWLAEAEVKSKDLLLKRRYWASLTVNVVKAWLWKYFARFTVFLEHHEVMESGIPDLWQGLHL